MPIRQSPVQAALDNFIAIVSETVRENLRHAVLGNLSVTAGRPGRPQEGFQPAPALNYATSVNGDGQLRKKREPTMCPVPGCKNVAAPVFGMVCKDHKDIKKSDLKKYRADAAERKKQAKQLEKMQAKQVASLQQ